MGEMTSRERWLAVLNRETPDRIPMDFWATSEATKILLAHMDCSFDEAMARLHIDLPLTLGGHYTGANPPAGQDIWGVTRRTISHGSGSYDETTNAPLAAFETAEEIAANYHWPNPDDWDYSHIPDAVAGQEHRLVRGGGSEPFLLYKVLRGEEQAFMDMIENPEIVHYCLDQLFELAYQNTLRIYEAIPGRVDISYVAEDLGGQSALMYSPTHIRTFLLPRMQRMIDLVKSHGGIVFHHSDGAIRDILPDLIGIGIQVLNPVQWRLEGMDREGLKRDFGDALIFHGAVDNQTTLPFGSPDEVRQEVEDCIRILGEGGGYILAPCHNLQSNTPPENIVAMYEAGYVRGRVRYVSVQASAISLPVADC